MLIERPPRLFRLCFPGALFRADSSERAVYLTFDDGPVPEVTPAVLDILKSFGIKATFFMVGDNARRHPELMARVKAEGHTVGNHTMHHLNGMRTPTATYLTDADQCAALTGSRLFRPPHGMMRPRQLKAMLSRGRVVIYDLVTRDYNRSLTPDRVVRNVSRYARPGSIIVFHDSLKGGRRTLEALPRCIEWLKHQGYKFKTL